MVTTVHIVIPVRDQLPITASIIDQLKRQIGWDKCWIYDNGSIDETWDYLGKIEHDDERFHRVYAAGRGIYNMWGDGFRVSKNNGADYVAILNNDLNLFPNTIQAMKKALDHNKQAWISYPDYNATVPGPIKYKETKGTYRHGGMSGFCFMLRAQPINWEPLVDPQFKWWGGDDDIAFTVEKWGGKQIRVLGLPIEHLMESTARHHSLGAQKGVDLQAVIKKWGR